jgi:tetratricopeptide (TPR) repeat protein
VIVPLVVLAMAVSPVQQYNLGNRLYAQKDYAGAARAYQAALEAGPNAAVEYNLGNALFKSGKIGLSILHYRRARFLDPRDSDVAANLNFARSYRVDKVLTVPGPLARALDRVFRGLSLREAALVAAVGFALAGLAFALWIVRRWNALIVLAAVFLAIALAGFVSERLWSAELSARPAVVILPEVHALSGPAEDAKEILLLHDGTEVRIREARGDYVLAQIPGGSGGWIRRESVERIY